MNDNQSKIWEDLGAYFDGELDQQKRLEIEQLLFEDPQYAEALVQWRMIRQQFQSLPQVDSKPRLTDSILQKVEKELNSGNLPWKPTENLMGQDPLFQTGADSSNGHADKQLSKGDLRTWKESERQPIGRLRNTKRQLIAVIGVTAALLLVGIYTNVRGYLNFEGPSALHSESAPAAKNPAENVVGKGGVEPDLMQKEPIENNKQNGVGAEVYAGKGGAKSDNLTIQLDTGSPLEKHLRNQIKEMQVQSRKGPDGFPRGAPGGLRQQIDAANGPEFDQKIAGKTGNNFKGFSQSNADRIQGGRLGSDSIAQVPYSKSGNPRSFAKGKKGAPRSLGGGSGASGGGLAASLNTQSTKIGTVDVAAMPAPQNFSNGFNTAGMDKTMNLVEVQNQLMAVNKQRTRNKKADKPLISNFAIATVKIPKSQKYFNRLKQTFISNGFTESEVQSSLRGAIYTKGKNRQSRRIILVGKFDSVNNILDFLAKKPADNLVQNFSDCEAFWFADNEMQKIISNQEHHVFYPNTVNESLNRTIPSISRDNLVWGVFNSINRNSTNSPSESKEAPIGALALDQRMRLHGQRWSNVQALENGVNRFQNSGLNYNILAGSSGYSGPGSANLAMRNAAEPKSQTSKAASSNTDGFPDSATNRIPNIAAADLQLPKPSGIAKKKSGRQSQGKTGEAESKEVSPLQANSKKAASDSEKLMASKNMMWLVLEFLPVK